MSIKEILEFNFISIGSFSLSLVHVILALLILIGARILIWFIYRVTRRVSKAKDIDVGRHYAFLQFAKYIIYTFAILFALQALGIKLSLLWGGAAALLVGIGLGLQQTFTDVISGLILLIEGAIEVGDIVEINGMVGTVTSIGTRTSKVYTRDCISIIIPNSKLVGDNATNWSHDQGPTRFKLEVGVSYRSDMELVTKLLLKAAENHPGVLETPKPQVQFHDFGNSSLDFQLYFFCLDYLRIEVIKSELRYKVTALFRENGVEIPFPQRDLWLRTDIREAKEMLGA